MCQLCRPIKTNGQRYRVPPILILGPGWINQIKVQFNSAKGLKLPTGVPKRSEYKTKAAFVEFVKKSFADGAALIQSKGDKGLDDLWVDPFSNRQVRFPKEPGDLWSIQGSTTGCWLAITASPVWCLRSRGRSSDAWPATSDQPKTNGCPIS